MSSGKKRHGGHTNRGSESKQVTLPPVETEQLQSDSGAEATDRSIDPSSSEVAPPTIDPFFVEPEEMAVVEVVDEIIDSVLDHVDARSVDDRVVSYAVSWVKKEMEDIIGSIFMSRDEGETIPKHAMYDSERIEKAKLPWRPDEDMGLITPDSWARGTVPVRKRAVQTHRRTGGLGVPGEKAPSVVMSQRSLSRSRASNYQRRATQHAASIAAAMKGNTGEVARGETVVTEESAQAKKTEEANATAERRAVRKQAEARKRALEDRMRRERRAKEEHERSVRLMRELASSEYTLDHNGNVVFVSREEKGEKLANTRVKVGAKVIGDGDDREKEKSKDKDKDKEKDKGKKKGRKEKKGKETEKEKEKEEKESKRKEEREKRRKERGRGGGGGMVRGKSKGEEAPKVPVLRVGKKGKDDREDVRPKEYQPAASAGSLVNSMRVAPGVQVYDGTRKPSALAGGGGGGISSPPKRKDDGGRVHVSKKEYDAFIELQQTAISSGKDFTADELDRITSLSASLNLPVSVSGLRASDSSPRGLGGGGGVVQSVRSAKLPAGAFAPSPHKPDKRDLPRLNIASEGD